MNELFIVSRKCLMVFIRKESLFGIIFANSFNIMKQLFLYSRQIILLHSFIMPESRSFTFIYSRFPENAWSETRVTWSQRVKFDIWMAQFLFSILIYWLRKNFKNVPPCDVKVILQHSIKAANQRTRESAFQNTI